MKLKRVVNIKTEKCDLYGGRGKGGIIPPPPQPGWLGNPFPMQNYSDIERQRVIDQYEMWFNESMLINMRTDFRKAIIELAESDIETLGCYCYPKPCHLDVVARWCNEHINSLIPPYIPEQLSVEEDYYDYYDEDVYWDTYQ